MDDTRTWYLLKHDDGALFGPVSFFQLKQWAAEAQISPLDKISTDQQSWMKAPMLPELKMDYLIQVSPEQFYGPTTLGAVREFIQMGEIAQSTRLINCCDGTELVLEEIEELAQIPIPEERPIRTSIRVNLQQRIRELEESLMEERRARETAEHLIAKLEARLAGINKAAAI